MKDNKIEEVISRNQDHETHMDKKSHSKKKNIMITILVLIGIVVIGLLGALFINEQSKPPKKMNNVVSDIKQSGYRIKNNSLNDFDLYFLQTENEKVNKVYSPLSIKYALAMLQAGATGKTKNEITSIIGDYQVNKYINSKNMSFANAMFINELYKSNIKPDYITKLSNEYHADVLYDPFENVNHINSWISNKTLKQIQKALESINKEQKFMLINSLGIDMEWQQKFITYGGASYLHEKFSWQAPRSVVQNQFNNNQDVSGMVIISSLNNYDIVNVLGEDTIRQTVGNELRKYLEDPDADRDSFLNGDYSEENIMIAINKYLDDYIKAIDSNYKKVDKTTDFSFYVDDSVKVFSKDLKEYNGTTLEYVGIMPTTEDLDQFIKNTNTEKMNTILSNLKELKPENVEEGVITLIKGYIPKFKFDYQLDLKKDLQKLGITSVFDQTKSDLSNMTSEKNMFIEDAMHKTNIEFTQDGIKAAAVTDLGGGGAGESFNYLYEVPVKQIDLTFDKPYMFLIRNKSTGEIWFTGTVYNPLKAEEETGTILSFNEEY